MKKHFYKLFFTFLFIIVNGVAFAQTTITFTGVAPTVDYTYIGSQNLDVAVNSKTLRFSYNNANMNGSQGGPNFYMADDGSGTTDGTGVNQGNRGLIMNEMNSSDALTISYTDNSAFSFNSLKVIDFSVLYNTLYPGSGGPAHALTINGYNGSTLVASIGFTYTYNAADYRNLVNTLTAAPAFSNVTSVVITTSDGSGFYDLFDDVVVSAVVPVITLTPTLLKKPIVGTTYGTTMTASGGTAPYTYSVTAGTFPTGLILSSTGVISGKATAGGTFNFTVTATDASSFTGSRAYSLGVGAPTLNILPITLPAATQGVPYSQTVTGSGGTAPYRFVSNGGALPTGLTLSSAGVLSGTPTVSGSFSVRFNVIDNSTGTGPYSSTRTYPTFVVNAASITAGGGPLTAMSTTYGLASTPAPSFTVSGTNLTAGILIAPADAAFEVSKDNGTTYSSTVTLAMAAGSVPTTTILTRLAATATAGNHSGNIVLSSSGVTSVNVATVSSTVSPAPLTITADNQTNVYGATLPTLTASYTGFVNGDNSASLTTQPTLTTTATSASSVAGSPYAITASGAVSSNYSIGYVAGSLSVITAPLTITADDQNSIAGQALPTLTASYSGFVNNDTQASLTTLPTITTTGTPSSATGPYPITASGAVDANYAIGYAPGTLTITPSTNATLSNLTLTGTLTPVFAIGTTSYTSNVSNSTALITVTPTAADTTATIKVNGTTVTSGSASGPIALSVGDNTLTTVATAQDGTTTATYTVTITRAASANATLANLAISSGTLTPVFASGTTSYTATVGSGTTSITLTPTTTDANATLKVNGTTVASGTASGAIALNVGDNVITTVITAQDGSTTDTYTVTVTRPSTNANLKLLLISSHTALNQTSGAADVNYTTSVTNGTASVTVSPTAVNAGATITVNGNPVTSGTASAPISLNAGPTTINLQVTAQDGITTRSYAITVTQAGSNDASLATLTLSSRTALAPTTGAANINYATTVPCTTGSVTITPATFNAGATVTVNGNPVTSGTASGPITLTANATTVINLLVTAQDRTTTTSYSVAVTRLPSTDASLKLIVISSHTVLTPTSGPANVNYTTSVSSGTALVTLTPTTNDATATVTVNGTPVASGTASAPIALNVGATTINLLATAQDGVTTKSFSITVNQAGSSDAGLKLLTVSTHTALTQTTGPADVNYITSVSNGTASLTVTPVTDDVNATVSVNGTPVISGIASGAIALNLGGPTTISLLVMAQDGTTAQTYSIMVNQAGSNDARLKTLTISTRTALTQTTGAANINFATTVNNGTPSLTITPKTDDPNATIMVNGSPATSGSAFGPIVLNAGPTTINLLVTAQDGVTTTSYSIRVSQSVGFSPGYATYQPSSVNTLEDSPQLAADDGILVHQGVSPNGDGINDYLLIEGLNDYPDNHLMITDRSGTKVFEVKGYNNGTKVFDGHSNSGTMQLPGTYYYSLEYRSGTEIKHKTGYIILKY